MVRLSAFALTAALVIPMGLIAAPVSAQQVALPPADAIRAYAAKFGAPGTPEYSAALRVAIAKAADQMQTKDEGKYDTSMRSIAIDTDKPASIPNLNKPRVVDEDQRYQNWLETAASNPVVDIGRDDANPLSLRSIGGQNITNLKEYSEVGIAAEHDGRRITGFCSGVLIDPQTILTAAHCLCGHQKFKYVVFGTGLRSSKNRIEVAGHRGQDGVQCEAQGVSALQHWQSLAGRDIALIRLKQALPNGIASPVPPERIGGLPLLKQQAAAGNTSMLVVGFGWNTTTSGEDLKNMALVPVLSADCSDKRSASDTDAATYGCKLGAEILSMDPRNEDPAKASGPCHGDSGGGAFVLVDTMVNGKMQRTPVLVGIVSRSIANHKQECGDGAIYTLLTDDIMNWVKTTTADLAK